MIIVHAAQEMIEEDDIYIGIVMILQKVAGMWCYTKYIFHTLSLKIEYQITFLQNTSYCSLASGSYYP